ncbi:MAG: glycine cleavage system H protein [Oceanicoccus sp.]
MFIFKEVFSMSNTPSELKYASSHEWALLEEDGTVTIGITDHAQEALGDVVYVEAPEVGTLLAAGDEAGVVESVKAASDLYAPISGEVIAVNEALEEGPEIVNSEPYTEGWFYKLKPNDVAELENLLTADEYDEQCQSE